MTLFLAAALLLGTQIVVDPPKPKDDVKQREAYQHYVRGQEFLSSERFEKAVEEFRAATDRDHLFTDAYFGLGHAYMGLRRFASAAQAYERCLDASRTIFGMREQNRAKTDQLITDQLRALREALAQTTKMANGQRNAVIGIESRIRELERSKSGLIDRFEPPAQVLLALGSAHFRNGDATAAREQWEQAVKSNSKLGEAWNNLAVVYMQSGRQKDALDAVRNAEKSGFRVNPKLKDEITAAAGRPQKA
jgi:tetratricopeptide (TPR) repeat protein